MGHQDLIPSTEHQDSWSSLPSDLLSLILSNLYAVDNAIFRSVCKTWRSITIAPPRQLPSPFDHADSVFPWLFKILKNSNTGNDIGKFFHPIHNYTWEMNLPPKVLRSEVQFSKHGWLLKTRDGAGYSFLFNPMTKEIIELPDPPPLLQCLNAMFFTSPPDSPDCFVVRIESGCFTGSICVHTLGEVDWKRHHITHHKKFELSDCLPILHKGSYYCLDAKGNLGMFDLKDIEHSWVTYNIAFPLHRRHIKSIVQTFLVENEGELVAVLITRDDQKVHVLKLHPTRNIWEPIRSLGNNMLFVSRGTSFSKRALLRGTGDKIFGPNFWGKNSLFCFYSLKTGKYHSFFDDSLSSKDSYGITFLQGSSWFMPM